MFDSGEVRKNWKDSLHEEENIAEKNGILLKVISEVIYQGWQLTFYRNSESLYMSICLVLLQEANITVEFENSFVPGKLCSLKGCGPKILWNTWRNNLMKSKFLWKKGAWRMACRTMCYVVLTKRLSLNHYIMSQVSLWDPFRNMSSHC